MILAKVRKGLQETKDTKSSSKINSAVKQSIDAETGVMLWVHKTQTKTTEYYKFWEDRVIEAIFKKNRGVFNHLRFTCSGRKEKETENFCQ